MKLYIKLFSFLFVFFVFCGFSEKVFADTSVYLKDDKENKVVVVAADSKEHEITAISMNIFFSSNITVKKVEKSISSCSFGFNGDVEKNRVISRCFNDGGIKFTGEIMRIFYETIDDNDYYFYVDESSVDIAGSSLGSVEDINRPEDLGSVVSTVLESSYAGVDSAVNDGGSSKSYEPVFWSTVKNFLDTYKTIVLTSVVFLLLLIVLIVLVPSRKGGTV